MSAMHQLLRTTDTEADDSPRFTVVMKYVLRLLPEATRARRMSLEALQQTVQSILSDPDFPPVAIIVDALGDGKCDEATAEVERLRKLIAEAPNTRIVVLTHDARPHNPTHLISIQAETIASDVEVVVKARLEQNPRLRSLADSILPAILKRSSGMFLIAELLLDDLKDAVNREDCTKILEHAPSRLEDYYERLWTQRESSLPTRNRAHRDGIFLILLAGKGPMHTDIISQFGAIDSKTKSVVEERRLLHPADDIGNLCRPFVRLSANRVQIAHQSMHTFIRQKMKTYGDPNAYLAEKCLLQLSDEKYAQPMFAAAALRRHIIDTKLKPTDNVQPQDTDAIPYDYAALHWQDHVIDVADPSDSLLRLVQTFIISIAVVSWAERLADLRSQVPVFFLNFVLDVRTKLQRFLKRLTPMRDGLVHMEDYYVEGHRKLRKALTDDDGQVHILPYLPSYRLGQWYSLSQKSKADQHEAYKNKERVVDGFSQQFGRRDPLTLQARTSWVNEFWFQELIQEAVDQLTMIVNDYQFINLADSPPYFQAVQNLASGNFFLTEFDKSVELLRESGSGLLAAGKEKEWIFQVNNLIESRTQDRRGELTEACNKARSILKVWAPVAGDTNGLTLLAKDSLGSVYRKQEDYEEAKSQLLYTWKHRYDLFTIENTTTVDSGLHLAITFREAGELSEAEAILQQVEVSSIVVEDFSRRHQAIHVRALISFDRGNFRSPLDELIKAVNETTGPHRARNNREAMWVRTTAADALRAEGRESDALMLFSELVTARQDRAAGPPSPSLLDEPESAAQLRIAEEAVRLVKGRKKPAAEKLLRDNDLQWVRPKDFWIRQGVAADTAWMKEPQFDDFEHVALPARAVTV